MRKFIANFLNEFKEFAFKGNMIDLAVGMVIGTAFSGLVNELVNDIIMPILSLVTGKINFENMFIPLAGQTTKVYARAAEQGSVLAYGSFITAIINFLIMALVVFLFIKQINQITALGKLLHAKEAPKEKECMYCKTMIPAEATRCPHCTSKLPGFREIF